MNQDGFILYLKKRGKKTHVIQELIHQMERFEFFLSTERGKTLDETVEEDIIMFAKEFEKKKNGAAQKDIRGLALYFHYLGNENMGKIAAGLREDAIAKNRASFQLRKFMGFTQGDIALLESAGISHADTMLEKGATAEARQMLANETGIPLHVILELVKLSDLARIEGVKAIRARLYYDAGVDTVEKLATQDDEKLLRSTADFVKRTGFSGNPPLPKEVHHTILAARKLPKIVTYD